MLSLFTVLIISSNLSVSAYAFHGLLGFINFLMTDARGGTSLKWIETHMGRAIRNVYATSSKVKRKTGCRGKMCPLQAHQVETPTRPSLQSFMSSSSGRIRLSASSFLFLLALPRNYRFTTSRPRPIKARARPDSIRRRNQIRVVWAAQERRIFRGRRRNWFSNVHEARYSTPRG
ncbi:hypothetical protein C2E23DRAFT_15564 [Lenzites betulinus]|nr:hypothetical protein C2E23DRAFT_15564 [Lenzites betulinus]